MRIAAMFLLAAGSAIAQTDELEKLKKDLELAGERIEALEKAGKEPAERASTADIARLDLGGGASARLMDLSLDILACVGTSTEPQAEIDNLYVGHHDPQVRGFTIQNVELTASGAVDPYFNAQAHVTFVIDQTGETEVELEEAYFTTTSLPLGFQVRGGQVFLEFGRLNPTHPHAWQFVDQPIVSGRFFGGDGLRSQGARLSWLAPTPWYLELIAGVYNAGGVTAFSFNNEDEAAVPSVLVGRHVRSLKDMLYLGRIHTNLDLGDTVSASLGASWAHGPNATGWHADTDIYGADLYVRWKPLANERGWPFVQVQAEVMRRHFERATGDDGAGTTFEHDVFYGWGFYAQAVVGFTPGWTAGLRYELCHDHFDEFDPRSDRRYRISPAVTWYPTEFSKIRLQYNFDHATHIGRNKDAHSIWLQVEFLLGKHGAHKF